MCAYRKLPDFNRPRAAVVIEPVSADSLRKTGIFAVKAGDFRRFPPQVRRTGSPETKSNARKAGISGPFSRLLGSLAERRNGWLGREGSNLRMAESKSAALPLGYAPIVRAGEHGIAQRDRFRHRRSIEGATPFQQAVGGEFHPKIASIDMSLYNGLCRGCRRAGFSRPGGANTAQRRVETTPVSWEDGGSH